MVGVDFQHRQIGFLIDADYLSAKTLAAEQANRDPVSALDHVMVGNNVSLRIDDEAAADSMGRPWRWTAQHVVQRILCATGAIFVVTLR